MSLLHRLNHESPIISREVETCLTESFISTYSLPLHPWTLSHYVPSSIHHLLCHHFMTPNCSLTALEFSPHLFKTTDSQNHSIDLSNPAFISNVSGKSKLFLFCWDRRKHRCLIKSSRTKVMWSIRRASMKRRMYITSCMLKIHS